MTWRRALLLAALLALLAGCGSLLGDDGDNIDMGLGVLQWGLTALGLGGAGVGVKAYRTTRRQGREPSRAAGDVAELRRLVDRQAREVVDLRQQVRRMEWLLLTQGMSRVPEDPSMIPAGGTPP